MLGVVSALHIRFALSHRAQIGIFLLQVGDPGPGIVDGLPELRLVEFGHQLPGSDFLSDPNVNRRYSTGPSGYHLVHVPTHQDALALDPCVDPAQDSPAHQRHQEHSNG